MDPSEENKITYRATVLPGIGRVMVPEYMTDEDVMAEMAATEAADEKEAEAE
jgi:hypothetical protein